MGSPSPPRWPLPEAPPRRDPPPTEADEEESCQIVGHVVDSRSTFPLGGARVSILGTSWASAANAQGRFVLDGLAPGFHTLRIEQLGYHPLAVRVEAAAPADLLYIALEPDPIMLEGLEVVTSRFERRRRATGVQVTAFEVEALANSTNWSVEELISQRFAVMTVPCPNGELGCIWARGRVVEPLVYIDEVPQVFGWAALADFQPQDFHMIEVYQRGQHVRLYTHHFMERATRVGFLPIPIG